MHSLQLRFQAACEDTQVAEPVTKFQAQVLKPVQQSRKRNDLRRRWLLASRISGTDLERFLPYDLTDRRKLLTAEHIERRRIAAIEARHIC